MAKSKTRGPSKKEAFLAAFAISGRVSAAARAAKVDRDMHYRWMADDPDYPERFEAARRQAADGWQDEAVRRAVDGVFEPTTYQGQFTYPIIGFEKDENGEFKLTSGRRVPIYGKKPYGVLKYSDKLLEFLLRGGKPETYRERGTVEVTGAAGGPVELAIVARLSAARDRLQKPPDPPAPVEPSEGAE